MGKPRALYLFILLLLSLQFNRNVAEDVYEYEYYYEEDNATTAVPEIATTVDDETSTTTILIQPSESVSSTGVPIVQPDDSTVVIDYASTGNKGEEEEKPSVVHTSNTGSQIPPKLNGTRPNSRGPTKTKNPKNPEAVMNFFFDLYGMSTGGDKRPSNSWSNARNSMQGWYGLPDVGSTRRRGQSWSPYQRNPPNRGNNWQNSVPAWYGMYGAGSNRGRGQSYGPKQRNSYRGRGQDYDYYDYPGSRNTNQRAAYNPLSSIYNLLQLIG